jgi:hypothetical protein
MANKEIPKRARMGRIEEPSNGRNLAKDMGVTMLSVEVTALVPGVTLTGVNVAVAPAGKPEAVKTTALVYAPPCGFTLMV